MKYFTQFVILAVFSLVVALTPSVVSTSLSLQKNKSDLGELNHIYYGIFNVNAWKGQLAEIIYSEINHLDIKSTIKKLKGTIEDQLNTIIDKLNDRIREANHQTFGGRIKQVLMDFMVDVKEIKKGVPSYADALITEVTKPETEKQVKDMAREQLKSYFAKTYEKKPDVARQKVLERNNAPDVETAKAQLTDQVEHKTTELRKMMMELICLSAILFLIVGLFARRSPLAFIILSFDLLILMGIGVTTPMIDLDARISEMSFYLLGHKIVFENQVLYFQSKSVMNVFMLMMQNKDILMKFVGVLMVTFSVIIPVAKLTSSLVYYFNLLNARKNRFIKFVVFKSGKWSMADVMVVAIFMAYIGFSGIVSNQFNKMKAMVPDDVVFISTNGTTLQPGFYAFLAYAVLALVFSSYLTQTSSAEANGDF